MELGMVSGGKSVPLLDGSIIALRPIWMGDYYHVATVIVWAAASV